MTSKNRIFSILSTILVGLLPAVTAGAAISHETAPLSYSRNSGLAGAAANNLMLFGGAYVSGDHHDAVDIYNVQQDVELYNYVDIILRKYWMGTLQEEMRKKSFMNQGSTNAQEEKDIGIDQNMN